MCDVGMVNIIELNVLRDMVEVEGWVDKLLGGLNLFVGKNFVGGLGGGMGSSVVLLLLLIL